MMTRFIIKAMAQGTAVVSKLTTGTRLKKKTHTRQLHYNTQTSLQPNVLHTNKNVSGDAGDLSEHFVNLKSYNSI